MALSLIVTHGEYSTTYKKPSGSLAYVYQRYTFSNKQYYINKQQNIATHPTHTHTHNHTEFNRHTGCSLVLKTVYILAIDLVQ